MRTRATPNTGDDIILDAEQNQWDASTIVGIMSISQLIVLKRDPAKRMRLSDFVAVQEAEKNAVSLPIDIDDDDLTSVQTLAANSYNMSINISHVDNVQVLSSSSPVSSFWISHVGDL